MQKSIGFRGVFQEGLSPTYGGRSTVRLITDTGLPPHSSEISAGAGAVLWLLVEAVQTYCSGFGREKQCDVEGRRFQEFQSSVPDGKL